MSWMYFARTLRALIRFIFCLSDGSCLTKVGSGNRVVVLYAKKMPKVFEYFVSKIISRVLCNVVFLTSSMNALSSVPPYTSLSSFFIPFWLDLSYLIWATVGRVIGWWPECERISVVSLLYIWVGLLDINKFCTLQLVQSWLPRIREEEIMWFDC